ncbi:MAG: ribonuclease III [bacterium]|nr:ribonuclease III [bacterium]
MAKIEMNYEEFCKILGYTFNQIALYKKALTHSSLTKNKLESNERLEFLGDRVLGLSVAKMLYETYPDEDEGSLAIRHANLVSAKTCAAIAEVLYLPYLIELGTQEQKRQGYKNRNILADCVEAILGAVFMDSDFDTAYKVVEKLWKDKVKSSKTPIKDFKTTLQEYTQKLDGSHPEYILVSKNGPAHSPTFLVMATVSGITSKASGPSRKEAEQFVAADLVKKLNLIKED